jgi:hypothetical protein
MAKEWHPEKNGNLTPEDVTHGSCRKVWWMCKYGHEWQAVVKGRKKGSGCPVCFQKRATQEFNLRVKYPEIANEWHPEMNGNLTPEDVTPGSSKKVWWKCKCGHQWQAQVNARKKGTGCPVCAGRRPGPDHNLRVLYPEIATEWHPEKNGNLTPEDVTPGSNKKVWWLCENGHEWETVVKGRTSRGTGCPLCDRKRPGPDRKLPGNLPPDRE